MWIWDFELEELGLRQRSELYWQCERGFGLAEHDHISLFLWTLQPHSHSSDTPKNAFELTEFHITFLLDRDHIHFYYHEIQQDCWEPGGHTSSNQLRGLGYDPQDLIEEADAIACEFVAAIKGTWLDR